MDDTSETVVPHTVEDVPTEVAPVLEETVEIPAPEETPAE